MNNVQLIGRTTKDILVGYTAQTQTAVGRFTLAVNRRKKEDGTDFILCKVWGKTAEIMEKYVKKGHKVGITGRIETGSYKKDGVDHYTTEVVVETFEFLEPKHDQTAPQPSETPHYQTEPQQTEPDNYLPDGFEETEDDLPF